MLALLFALAFAAAPEPGVRFSVLASGEVTLGGETEPQVRPAADLEVEGPLALGPYTPFRVSTELRIFGQVGDTVQLDQPETFRALEVVVGVSRRVGRVTLGEQEVWTSALAFCGFSSLLGAEPAPRDRYPRRCAAGIRIEERTSGARLDVAYGRDEAAGAAGYGQVAVRGRMPVHGTAGALVIAGEAVLSIDGPYRRVRQRDLARLTVALNVPALYGVIRR